MEPGRSSEAASSKHHTVGGRGPNSYVQNSDYQKQLLVSAKDLIQDLISCHQDVKKLRGTFRIADFGCSVGPNTFLAVENIIAAVKTKYTKSWKLDFQVFFNDLVGNDFNTLFQSLSSCRTYFVAAVAGSFHTRLFPERNLHFAHCSTALHWLSRIPKEVTDPNSSAWNGSKIHYFGAGEGTKQAYFNQYKKDMEAFLGSRASELVPGGLMALVVIGFPDGVVSADSSIGITFDLLRSCLQDMTNAGKIGEEKVRSFNLPFYYPSPLELEKLIEANGNYDVKRIAALASPMRCKPDPRVVTSHLRAVIGTLVEEHFGDGIVEELFSRHYEKLLESPALVDERLWKETNYLLFLKRKE